MSDRREHFSPLTEVKFAKDQTGEFAGYASTFGGEPDTYGDLLAPGSFAKTLAAWKARGAMPAMLASHGLDDGLPVGRWLDMKEDTRGLWVRGKISNLDQPLGARIYGLLKDGALGALSIGFLPVKSAPGTGAVRRILQEVDLHEISLVGTPANRDALIQHVKSGGITTQRMFEKYLRDGGFPKSAAKALASGGWPALNDGRDDHDDAAQLVAAIKAAAERVSKLVEPPNGNQRNQSGA